MGDIHGKFSRTVGVWYMMLRMIHDTAATFISATWKMVKSRLEGVSHTTFCAYSFGYVVEGADFLTGIKEGDLIVSAKVTEGAGNLVSPS
jgi:hypothetical protein